MLVSLQVLCEPCERPLFVTDSYAFMPIKPQIVGLHCYIAISQKKNILDKQKTSYGECPTRSAFLFLCPTWFVTAPRQLGEFLRNVKCGPYSQTQVVQSPHVCTHMCFTCLSMTIVVLFKSSVFMGLNMYVQNKLQHSCFSKAHTKDNHPFSWALSCSNTAT